MSVPVTTQLGENQVLSTADLRGMGISGKRIRTLLSQGRIHRVERGTYTTSPPQGELLLRALLKSRPYLVFTGTTAVQLHSGQEITLPVEALAPPNQSAVSTPLLRVRRSRALHPHRLGNVPVVSAVVAARDALLRWGTEAEPRLVKFLEQQYSRRRGQERLDRDLGRMRGRLADVRGLVGRASIGADSESERRLARALKWAGLKILQNGRLGDYLWDVVIEEVEVVIDIDSYLYHGVSEDGETERTFILDRWKGNDAARRGWLVLRYTGECIFHHLDEVVEQILAAVAQRRNARRNELLPLETRPVWKWHKTLWINHEPQLPESAIPPAGSGVGH